MATSTIDFTSVIGYSKSNCFSKSKGKCAAYVKNAFQAGGCKYVSGNGYTNQNFCNTNSFKCIGDFVPIDKNPRAHGSVPMQFPEGYVQQVGDICLIKHGTYGHICYATGTGINDWVSDYWQRSPGQADGTGPYCYTGNYERVQFWRHESVMEDTPEVDTSKLNEAVSETKSETRKERREARRSANSSGGSANVVSTSKSMKGSKKKQGCTILGSHLNQKD